MTVLVTYDGEISTLRAAGLSTGYDSGGEVSGSVAFRDLERLANLPAVIRIAKQPDVHTD